MTYLGDDLDWVSVAQVRTKRAVNELELVLIAVGLKTDTRKTLWGWKLMTPLSQVNLARHHLTLYESENRVPAIRPDPQLFSVSWYGIAAYLLLIWGIFLLDLITFNRVFGYGVLHAGAVFEGYWWLTITALTLHADFPHILANSVFGAISGWVACRYFGSGLAWFLILLSGALGNFLDAAVQPASFTAIGASTANFGAVGLICGFVAYRRYVRGGKMSLNYAPIAAAIAMFVLFGIGSERTDVVGHFMGLLAGLGLGFLMGNFDPRWLGKSGQLLAAFFAVTAILFAWLAILA